MKFKLPLALLGPLKNPYSTLAEPIPLKTFEGLIMAKSQKISVP